MKEDFPKKKIAISANATVVGGVEEALIQLLRNIDYNKFDVTLFGNVSEFYLSRIPAEVFVASPGHSFMSSIKFLLGQYRFLDAICYLYRYLVCVALYKMNKKDMQAYHSMLAYQYCPMLSQERYDLVIAYTYMVASVVGNALYRLNSQKKVLWIHGDCEHGVKSREKLDCHVYNNFDKVFCCSEAVMNRFASRYPLTGRKAAVFYNIADTERILSLATEEMPFEFQRKAIVTVGRISSEKGQDMIPKTTRLLLDRGYHVFWYLIGDGDNRACVEKEIEIQGVHEHVFLLGTKENPYPYISNCDIYVQTSYTEGYCTTTVEAKILCKPIITTDAPGMREQFTSGEDGLIVDEMTPEALCEGIKKLIDNPEMNELFVSNLRKRQRPRSAEINKLYHLMEQL